MTEKKAIATSALPAKLLLNQSVSYAIDFANTLGNHLLRLGHEVLQ